MPGRELPLWQVRQRRLMLPAWSLVPVAQQPDRQAFQGEILL